MKELLKRFLNKEIGILYKDTHREVFARGILKEVLENSILLKTDKEFIGLDISSILKVKGKVEDYEGKKKN